MGQTSWTETREAELRQCIEDKMSASQTALRMGLSRNALIGKSHRMGLSFLSKSQPNRGSYRKRTGARPGNRNASGGILRIFPAIEPPPVERPPEFLGLTMEQLEDGLYQCRFMDEGLYCGQPSDGPWCSHHRKIVFYPITPGKRHAL